MPPARVALYVLSLGGVALGARSVLGAPPPFPVAVGALGAYLALAVAGAMVPQWKMYGDVVCRGEGRAVALTFDDGPDPETTPRVLSLLREAGAAATFFVIGEKAQRHPELLRAMVEAGHEIGLHGHSHSRLHALRSLAWLRADIARCRAAVTSAGAPSPRWFRPPMGHVTPRTVRVSKEAGLVLVAWSVRARDGWGAPSAERVVARVRRGLEPGAVVALHDARERTDGVPASVLALPAVLDELAKRALSPVTLTSLLGARAP